MTILITKKRSNLEQIKGFAHILPILLIFVLLVGGAYYYGKSSNKVVPAPSSSPIVSSVPSPATQKIPKELEEEVKTSSPKKISIVSTKDWKDVTLEGVSFKIPVEARCEPNETSCSFIYMSPSSMIPDRISVENYKGGSRRQQYFNDGIGYQDCHWIYEEAIFGTVTALQIAIDGGWCQGGGGGIIAVVGNKMVTYHNLGYDIKTKMIDRWEIRDTIVSTLKVSE